MSKRPFIKPPLSLEDQVKLLQVRGLEIEDHAKAEHYLKYIGYYRLVGYARHFRALDPNDPEIFREGTSFSDVLNLYIFDRKLRLLIFDAIERTEVAVRASLNNFGSISGGGPFWLTNANNFDYGRHSNIMDEIRLVLKEPDNGNHQHPFINHFYSTYSDPYPPSWMMMECFTLSASSRIYKNLKGDLRQEISSAFGLQHNILESWLHSISHCRNIVAHHSRCWKRSFTIRPKIPKLYRKDMPFTSEHKLYAQCWMLGHFLYIIADGSKWPSRLKALINSERPKTSLSDMGFPEEWHEHAFWNRSSE